MTRSPNAERRYSQAEGREALRTGRLPIERGKAVLAPTKEPGPGASESEIQAAIVRELRRLGYFVFHVPNGGKRPRIEAAIMVGMGVVAGVADLCVLLPHGRTLWLEVKRPGEGQTTAQIVFDEQCEVLGHSYEVARSVAEAVAAAATIPESAAR